jgi:hypothetical protein
MNRIVLTIVLISIYCCPLLANICNNDNDPVVVIVKDEQTTGKTKTNRTPARIPIECYYYPFANNLELSFLSNLGTVDVVLENQTTGGIQDYVGNSASGRIVILVEPDTAYRMDITTENGHNYYAVFFTDNDSDE